MEYRLLKLGVTYLIRAVLGGSGGLRRYVG